MSRPEFGSVNPLAPRKPAYQVRHAALLALGVHPMTMQPLLPLEHGKTCKQCDHCYGVVFAHTYYKCDAAPRSAGPSTDLRIKWPACAWFVPENNP